ncbi:hypothetical protein DFH28DRAFT_1155621 [Melampsora americana]|nr:hypothetical protein DFH28DRAFT_1155621 [Melampsora americana]
MPPMAQYLFSHNSPRDLHWVGLDCLPKRIAKNYDVDTHSGWNFFVNKALGLQQGHLLGLVVRINNLGLIEKDKDQIQTQIDHSNSLANLPAKESAPKPKKVAILILVQLSAWWKSIQALQLAHPSFAPSLPTDQPALALNQLTGPSVIMDNSTVPQATIPPVPNQLDDRMFLTQFCRTFDNFLKFCRISTNDTVTWNLLSELSLDHWSTFVI